MLDLVDDREWSIPSESCSHRTATAALGTLKSLVHTRALSLAECVWLRWGKRVTHLDETTVRARHLWARVPVGDRAHFIDECREMLETLALARVRELAGSMNATGDAHMLSTRTLHATVTLANAIADLSAPPLNVAVPELQ